MNGSFFWGDDRGFLKEGVKAYLMTPLSPLTLPTFLFVLRSIFYDNSCWENWLKNMGELAQLTSAAFVLIHFILPNTVCSQKSIYTVLMITDELCSRIPGRPRAHVYGTASNKCAPDA
jgi:hypothetical protein